MFVCLFVFVLFVCSLFPIAVTENLDYVLFANAHCLVRAARGGRSSRAASVAGAGDEAGAGADRERDSFSFHAREQQEGGPGDAADASSMSRSRFVGGGRREGQSVREGADDDDDDDEDDDASGVVGGERPEGQAAEKGEHKAAGAGAGARAGVGAGAGSGAGAGAGALNVFTRARQHKTLMENAVHKFNMSDKKGLAYAYKHGLVEQSARGVAQFFFNNSTLDKTAVPHRTVQRRIVALLSLCSTHAHTLARPAPHQILVDR